MQHQIEHDGLYLWYLLTPEQVLIVDLQNNVRCLDENGKENWSGGTGTPYTELACRGQMIYYVSADFHDESIYCIHLANLRQSFQDNKYRSVLHYGPLTKYYDTSIILADENHLVVISEHEEDEASPPIFHIYNFAQETWWVSDTAKTQLQSACLHADGDMLVLWSDDSLQKLKLDGYNQLLTERWTCTGLTGSISVCSASGITYVGASDCIYVISMFGESETMPVTSFVKNTVIADALVMNNGICNFCN